VSTILYDPDEYEYHSTFTPCPFHEKYPGSGMVAGCTCSASAGHRRRSDDEIKLIKERKLRYHEDLILAQAEAIKARRAAEAQ
jgi:hypothetical protein